MHCHKAKISALSNGDLLDLRRPVCFPTRKRNTSRANRRFVSSFGSVRRCRRCLCCCVMCVWVTSALDFVSDWRNVAIVQCCVCDLTALSAPSCRMQRHRSTTVNRFTSQEYWDGAGSLCVFPICQISHKSRASRSTSHTPFGPEIRSIFMAGYYFLRSDRSPAWFWTGHGCSSMHPL